MKHAPLFDGPPPLKALSVRQPWAHLIIHHGKDIENRSWRTSYRGPILIHASLNPAGTRIAEIEQLHRRCFDLGGIKFGGIIGQAELVDIVTSSTSAWFDGPYGWVLRNPQPLPFRPCKGALSIFEPDFR